MASISTIDFGPLGRCLIRDKWWFGRAKGDIACFKCLPGLRPLPDRAHRDYWTAWALAFWTSQGCHAPRHRTCVYEAAFQALRKDEKGRKYHEYVTTTARFPGCGRAL